MMLNFSQLKSRRKNTSKLFSAALGCRFNDRLSSSLRHSRKLLLSSSASAIPLFLVSTLIGLTQFLYLQGRWPPKCGGSSCSSGRAQSDPPRHRKEASPSTRTASPERRDTCGALLLGGAQAAGVQPPRSGIDLPHTQGRSPEGRGT